MKGTCDDIFTLLYVIANNKCAKLDVLSMVFKISYKSLPTNTSSQTNLSNQTKFSENELIDPNEELYLEIEEFKQDIYDKFNALREDHLKVIEQNKRLVEENVTLAQRLSLLETKCSTINTNVIYMSKNAKKNTTNQVGSKTMNTPAISSNNNLVNNENSILINNTKRNPKRTYSSMASNLNNEPTTTADPQSNTLVNCTLPKQQKLRNFNSFDPNSENKMITSTKSEGWKTVGKKNNNKSKSWLNSVGTKESNEFKVSDRLCTVYIGRVDLKMEKKDTENLLSSMGISFSNISQLTTTHNKFKSFTFSIKYKDKDIVYKKDLWPSGIKVNRYFYNKEITVKKNPNQPQSTSNVQSTSNILSCKKKNLTRIFHQLKIQTIQTQIKQALFILIFLFYLFFSY